MAIPWKPVVGHLEWRFVTLGRPHHTKEKGDLGVLKAQIDLFEQGFTICLPMTEHAPFDLIAYRDGMFRRIQVKYRALGTSGALQIKFSTAWADRNGVHTAKVDKSEVDLYCVYCPDTDECYYVDPDKFDSNVSLRVEKPKNGQCRKINFAKDFRWVP
jgi:hypothetical protein